MTLCLCKNLFNANHFMDIDYKTRENKPSPVFKSSIVIFQFLMLFA